MTGPAEVGSPTPRLLDGADPAAIVEAGRLLRQGSIVVLPTDTGYGIAAAVFQTASVERVFTIKRRDPTVRLPVLIATAADLPLVTREVPPSGWRLISKFWPGALSLVLPASASLPKPVTAGRGTVAVRVPNGRACLQVLEFLGEAVTGTSANVSGRPGATTAAEVVEQLGVSVDAILVDDAATLHPKPSSVVEFVDGAMVVHREGALSADALRAAAATALTPQTQLLAGWNRR